MVANQGKILGPQMAQINTGKKESSTSGTKNKPFVPYVSLTDHLTQSPLLGRAKIIRPAEVWSTFVTVAEMVWSM